LAGFHAKIGKDLLDVLMLVNRNRPIRVEVELDSGEGARGSQNVQLELRFQGSSKLLDLGIVRGCNQKVIDIDADDTVRLIEDAISNKAI
jgi:hypothetical protein